MSKYVKILLALLYLLQLPIIFRESVLELYKSATEALHRQTETAVQVEDGAPILRRAGHQGMLPAQELERMNPDFRALALLAYAFFEHGDHHHLPEDGKQDTPKHRLKRHRNERLIANLYTQIRKSLAPPLWSGANGGVMRLIVFPPKA